jgi:hypothetical protein
MALSIMEPRFAGSAASSSPVRLAFGPNQQARMKPMNAIETIRQRTMREKMSMGRIVVIVVVVGLSEMRMVR